MARPKLRLDLSTTEDKENVVAIKDVKRKIVPDGARDLQTLQAQVRRGGHRPLHLMSVPYAS